MFGVDKRTSTHHVCFDSENPLNVTAVISRYNGQGVYGSRSKGGYSNYEQLEGGVIS